MKYEAKVDKIASSTRNANLHREVVVGAFTRGAGSSGKGSGYKSSYNQIEDLHGRMVPVHAGDIIAGGLASGLPRLRRAYPRKNREG